MSHAKCQLMLWEGGCVKIKFIRMFCVTKWFQRKLHFKRKNKTKKLLGTRHVEVGCKMQNFQNTAGLCSLVVFWPNWDTNIKKKYFSQISSVVPLKTAWGHFGPIFCQFLHMLQTWANNLVLNNYLIQYTILPIWWSLKENISAKMFEFWNV